MPQKPHDYWVPLAPSASLRLTFSGKPGLFFIIMDTLSNAGNIGSGLLYHGDIAVNNDTEISDSQIFT